MCRLLFGALCLAVAAAADAQTTLNLSHDLTTLGIASSNMVPNNNASDAGPLFMAGVEYARTHGYTTVMADPGAYYFLSMMANTHAAIANLNGMTIDFQGSDLIFTKAPLYGLIVYTSTNVTLQNFTVDYQPLPFTQLRVVSIDVATRNVTYTVEPGYQHPSAFNNPPTYVGWAPPSMQVHTFRNGHPAPGVNRMLATAPFAGNTVHLNGFTAPDTVSQIRVGDVMVIAMRGPGDAINTNHCDGCTIRNVTVYSCACGGGGVQAISTQNSTFERIYMLPKPGTDRLISAVSSVVVGFDGPNNVIRLSRGIRTLDDSFWFYGRVVGAPQSQPASNQLVVAPTTAFTWVGLGDSVPNGSVVSFQRTSDGLVVASAVIQSQTAPDPQQTVTYTFTGAVPASVLNSTLMFTTDVNLNGAGSLLERSASEFQSHSGRGAYFAGLSNSTVRGNYLRDSAWAGLIFLQGLTPGDPATQPLRNIAVDHNVIDGTNLTPDWWWFSFGSIQMVTLSPAFDLLPSPVFASLAVTNNFIANSGRSAVWMGNTALGSVTNNYILSPNQRPDVANAYPNKPGDALLPLVIDASSTGITATPNTIDTASGRVFLTDTSSRELAAYAPGQSIRLNGLAVGGLASPVATLTDADGATLAAALSVANANALTLTVPAPSALGGAYITLTASGGAKYFGTLFVDSQDNVPALNGCTYQLSPAASAPAAGGAFSILVVTQAGCTYQSSTTSPFVTAGSSGSGTGVITVTFAANAGATRTAAIEIAGIPLTVTQPQNACAASLNTATIDAVAAGGAVPISVTLGACAWSTTNPASWIAVSPASGNGTTAVSLTIAPNFSADARVASIVIAGQTLTVTQTGGAKPALFGGPGQPALGHVQIVPFKFNNDAWRDLLLYNDSTGSFTIKVGTSLGTFADGPSGFWAPGWSVSRADFNGDGLDDLFLYNPTIGTFYKVINHAGGAFTYFTQGWAPGFSVFIVDFNGDGKSDVFLYNAASGLWYTCLSAGDGTVGFTYRQDTWAAGWQVYPADFNGDGKTDLFLYSRLSGLYYKVISVGDGSFSYAAADVWALTWTPFVVDLNGDGKSDVFLYDAGNGYSYRALSVGSGTGGFAYTFTLWAPGWQIQTADFDGDGRSDLLLYNPNTGLYYKALNNGATFDYFPGTWARWTTSIVDFNGDGKSDVLLIDPASGFWYQGLSTVPSTFSYTSGMFR